VGGRQPADSRGDPTGTETQSVDPATDPSSIAATASSSPSPSASVATMTCADGGACALGDTGPGGGLVFLISGGKTYEMAPKTWSGGGEDPTFKWCDTNTSVTGTSKAIGTGAQNTVLMKAGCNSVAGQSAADYAGGGKSDWFLPSKDELNEMFTRSRTSGFDTATYGFVTSLVYWSSSQDTAATAWYQSFANGLRSNFFKNDAQRVRPVRAF